MSSTAEAELEAAPVLRSTAEMRAETRRLAEREGPTFVRARAQLPKEGRTNQMLAATPNMSLMLKTYASGGENELHGHANEDHVFIILQGEAVFFGPNNEQKRVGKNDCVMLPRMVQYRFHAVEEAGPLVFLRVGALLDPSRPSERVDHTGKLLDGYSASNHEGPIVFSQQWFG